jgi:hypothetical protein|tara:strand:- start:3412 stop:3804 length:393 start_codon:yes stop_codon:yes gene_type:complete
MIFDLNSGAPEFNGAHYDPDADPFFFRQLSPTTYWGFSEKGGDRKKAGGKTQKGPEGVTLFAELQDAFIGVVEHVRNPPVACYSCSGTMAILKTQHGLNTAEAKLALSQLIACDLGPTTPCFLDSSPLQE